MNELVIMHDQQAVTTSLKIAEVFNKKHKDVLEAINNKIDSAEFSAQYKTMFARGEYRDRSGKRNLMYYLTRKGFVFIAMGFTGRDADGFKLNYIDAFDSMEQEVHLGVPQTLPEALRFAADQAEQIAKMQPKVDYFDTQMHNPGLMTTTVIAKRFGKSAVWLNRWLEDHGMIYRQGKSWVVRQKFAAEGYADYENWSDADNSHVHSLLKWTQKGQKFIYDCLAKEGIRPVMVTMRLSGKEVSK